jgi:hypothetical protein
LIGTIAAGRVVDKPLDTWLALLQICAGGKSDAGLEIFNALRNEIDWVDAELRKQRKGVVEMNARLRNGW